MYETNDFKRGLYIEVEGIPFVIQEFQHVKPGKGNAFTRTRMKNLLNNNVIEKTFKSGDRVGEPNLEKKQMQYLYTTGTGFQFMDMESFDQTELDKDTVGEAKNFLIEDMQIEALYYQGRPISLELPTFVNLKVTYCEPAIKGDTVSGGGKPATVQTGLVVSVPYHVKLDDVLKIDTRTGEYVEKVK